MNSESLVLGLGSLALGLGLWSLVFGLKSLAFVLATRNQRPKAKGQRPWTKGDHSRLSIHYLRRQQRMRAVVANDFYVSWILILIEILKRN